MNHYKPQNFEFTQAGPGAANKILHTQDMSLAIWKMDKGTGLAKHDHIHEQICCVIQGAIEFQLDSGKVLVKAGEMIVFAPNESHEGIALEDSLLYDAFAPVREDFKAKFPMMQPEK